MIKINPITNILNDHKVMIIDGALATELEKHGCDLKDSLWSAKVLMENPEIIQQVHTDYFQSGADCALTASYQATIEGFMDKGLSRNEAKDLIKKSVEIAIDARDKFWADSVHQTNRPKPIIAASVGPYGAFLADGSEYRGDYQVTEEQLYNFHKERIEILIEAGADILACETIPCLLEAKAITRVLKEFPDAYAWISFSAKDEFHISDGEKIANCAKWLDKEEQIAAIGINCTAPHFVESLIKQINNHTTKPIIVYPNSGAEYDATTKTWNPSTEISTSFNNYTKQWYNTGATIIGGCCRTTPSDIQTLANWARK